MSCTHGAPAPLAPSGAGRAGESPRRGGRSRPASSPSIPSPRSHREGYPAERSTSLGDYLREIRDEPLLSAAEERSLAEAIQRGDAEATDRFIRANLRLVVTIARKFLGRGLDFEDLVGEGNLGLIRAVSEFDPSFGVRFSTYASYWIKESIRRALITTSAPIRLPAHVVTLLAKWRRAEHEFRSRHGHPPTADQITAMLDLTDSKRGMIEQAIRSVQFLPGGSEAEADALERAEATSADPGDAIEAEDLGRAFRERMGRLDDRERTVIALHLGLGGGEAQSHSEIAQGLGITREWVRKLKQRAIEKLGAPGQPAGPPPASLPVSTSIDRSRAGGDPGSLWPAKAMAPASFPAHAVLS